MRLKKPRLEPLPDDQVSDDIRKYTGRPTGPVLNIYRTLAHHPKLAKRWLVFGSHVLAKSAFPERERELVILRTGWRCRSEYEWGQHARIGKASGLTDEEIVRITRGPQGEGWSERDRALLQAADELHDDQFITDATWQALAAHYDTQQLLDLIFTIGQYTLVCMALNSLGVQLEPGTTGFPS
jgi:4-carboxymuconolactone decarboxylase